MIARILFATIIVYIFVVAFVYITQRYLQYYPIKKYTGDPKQNGVPVMEEIQLQAEDGQELYAWFAEPKEKEGKIFIIYHGNAGTLAGRADKARQLIALGYGVYMCEYRGYGGIKGKITEENLYKDGRAAVKFLADKGYNISQLVLYGESIGSGIATQMAKEFNTKYMVLEGGFSSAMAVGRKVYPYLPVDLMLKDRYDNISKIKDIKVSLLMIHGKRDNIVDIDIAKELYEVANHPKEFIEFDNAGHVDLFSHGAAKIIDGWLKGQDTE